MSLDPNNVVVKLCVQGMEQEMAGRPALAKQLFTEAWEKAGSDHEKFTAAHYMARVQDTVAAKLKWDQTALDIAQKIDDTEIKGAFPSLYLNIGKCYEDLQLKTEARHHYALAQSYAGHLKDDGYGHMIRTGIEAGLKRVD